MPHGRAQGAPRHYEMTASNGVSAGCEGDGSPLLWDAAQFGALVANVPGAVYRCAPTSDWDMEFMSGEIEAICGYPSSDFVSRPAVRSYASIIHEDDRDRVERDVSDALATREPFVLDYRVIHRTGEVRWVHERGRGVFTGEGDVLFLDGAIFDHTERKRLEEELAHLAYHDFLTGLPNRASFHDHVEVAVARSQRHGGFTAVLFVDLDDFKLVNDCFGHVVGDELLCKVAERLRSALRDTDVVARQGGDEFLVVISEPGDAGGRDQAAARASILARRIQDVVNEPVVVAGVEVSISASVGIALYPAHASTVDDLLKCADIAMYQAKEAGRNAHRHYTDPGDAPMAQLSMAGRLRRAVDNDEFVLHYQPMVELDSGLMVGAEALIRWNDPKHGLVPPGDFIELAERTGLIEPISKWVIEEACRQSVEWKRLGLDLCVSINLPARFWEPTAIGSVLDTIESFGLSPSRLMVEITESAAMASPNRNDAIIDMLQDRGLSVAIDDFGTGHSSLARLNQLHVNTLKIDRTFVRDVPGDAQAATLVSAIIQMAQTLGLTPLAEGVENDAQRQFLLEQGCRCGQGFYFSRPIPAGQIPAYVPRGAGPSADVAWTPARSAFAVGGSLAASLDSAA
jgi:diguanylate cyclase (GGDEF)-like protein/PAS domain S-box-containing protein